ncbi:rod shape-determining protein MreD [uncultured Psychrobacter sp.]|uniref:rod shape-determining protein MreD n=1 Tax=uncultured Psychrobacter sp. TaxID=259303 RepID=UPI00345A1D93
MALSNSEQSSGTVLIAIALSFVVASSPSVYPLSPSMATLRPMIMIMVLIFWLLFQPRYVGVFTAFIIGLIADLLMDTHLGQQAFAAVIMVLALRLCSLQVKQLNTFSAWLLATIGLIVFQLSLWLLQLMAQSIFVVQSGLSLLISILSWPLILLILRGFTR